MTTLPNLHAISDEAPRPSWKESLIQKIEGKSAIVSIVGLGYVGLPLALEVAKSGFRVLGIENNPTRCQWVNQGRNYIQDVQSAEMRQLVDQRMITASVSFDSLEEADIIIICVPTPLTKNKEPDISYIQSVTSEISSRFRPGKLVILESTTYPGTTEEVIRPQLDKKGHIVGKDYFLAFSPERVDPGNQTFQTANTAKVVGGMTSHCLDITDLFYRQFIHQVVRASSPKVAEMTKLFENIFRTVNIALVNEMAMLCERMNIDIYEVIRCAETKPYGFKAFWPGPGVGGHCIPLDPHYLAWKGREFDFHARFIQLAGEINGDMPRFVVAKVGEILNAIGKPVRNAKILQLGIAYKKDIDDYRESPAVQIFEHLTSLGAQVTVSDPYVSKFYAREHDPVYEHCGPGVVTAPLTRELIEDSDLVLIATDHSTFPYSEIVERAQVIFDTRNATGFREINSKKIVKLSTKLATK